MLILLFVLKIPCSIFVSFSSSPTVWYLFCHTRVFNFIKLIYFVLFSCLVLEFCFKNIICGHGNVLNRESLYVPGTVKGLREM